MTWTASIKGKKFENGHLIVNVEYTNGTAEIQPLQVKLVLGNGYLDV